MADEQLTHQQIEEIQDTVGLALLIPGEITNDFVDMLDQVCGELKAARKRIVELETLNAAYARTITPVNVNLTETVGSPDWTKFKGATDG